MVLTQPASFQNANVYLAQVSSSVFQTIMTDLLKAVKPI